jgi:uncharacterized repeat protein (TIGR03803 family)
MKRVAILVFTAAFLYASALRSSAQIFTLLHSFVTSDGAQPYAALAVSKNALYSTTKFGGSTGNGTVFTINTDGTGFNVLHNFSYDDGGDIESDLLLSGGILYGTAYQGCIDYEGGLFTLSTNGSGFIDDYTFYGLANGSAPKAGLILADNILYGTTSGGGSTNDAGTIFSVQTNGVNLDTLFVFSGTNGNDPWGDLVLGGDVLYGTTYNGGTANGGVIFSIQTNGAGFTVLHNFTSADGLSPQAGLILAGDTLYGTASVGGAFQGGTLFSIKTNGTGFTVLHEFSNVPTNGNNPVASLLLLTNVLYGTTDNGGEFDAGTVFSINTNGTGFNIIYSFSGNTNDGGNPDAPVVLVGDSLYGTSVGGGATGNGAVYGLQIFGLVFDFVPTPQIDVPVGAGGGFFGSAQSLTFPQATLLYQWRINGVDIPGATDTFLPYSDAQPTNGGNVTLTVGDGAEAQTTQPAEFSVSVATSASGNDNFVNRFDLGAEPSGVVSSSNGNATKEPGEPDILPGNPGGRSIWFRWTPVNSGSVVFTTQGSTFDTIMGAYTGRSVSNLTAVPSAVNDDDSGGYLTSLVSFNYTAGTEYEIVVDGYRAASGYVVLNWTTENYPSPYPAILQAPPAQTVVSNGSSVTFVCQASFGTPTWYFNGQQTGITGTNFTISSVGDTNVGSYVAEVSGGGGVTATQPAHLQVNTLEDGTTDTNSIVYTKFLASSGAVNDSPSFRPHKLGGGDTGGFSVSQTFSTVGAQGEPGEPAIDGQIGGSPVWYAYIAPTNGSMVVSTAGSGFNTLLGIFIGPGDSFSTLTNIAAGYTTNRTLNGQPRLLLTNVPAGQTNYIVVDGYLGASGVVHLNIGFGNPVTITNPPQNQLAAAGGTATFTVGATGSTPFKYAWQFNGTNLSGATSETLTIANVQTAKAGTYTVVVSNLISAASNSATLSVGALPTITTQALSHTVAPGSTAKLKVTATGTPPLTYQWTFDGNSIGTNGPALSVTNFQATNEGTYNVVVSNALGSVTGSNALVLLNAPLRVGAFSLSGGLFQLQLIGAAGSNYALEASSNLFTWTTLFTNKATNGFLILEDTNAGTLDWRFYRGVTN